MPIPKKLSDFSLEQYEYLIGSFAKVNIASGPVRSGKNFIENIRLLEYAKYEPIADPSSPLFFCGASRESVYSIFLEDLLTIAGPLGYYNEHKGKGRLCGRPFYVFGYADADDFKRLRGRTGGGAIMTEATLCHPVFLSELEARLSVDGASLFMDTNPDSPFHFIYTDYVNNKEKIAAGNVRVFYFTFDSNLSLKDSYKEHLKLTYKPGTLLYKRMIMGQWVAAEGVVYDSFDAEVNTCEPADIPKLTEYVVCCDYGTSNPCAFLLLGRVAVEGKWKYYLAKEYYHKGKEQGQKTNPEYTQDLIKFIEKQKLGKRIKKFIIDPSAASFKADLKKSQEFRALGIPIQDAVNDVLEGIALVASMFYEESLTISTECKHTLAETPLYIWDKNAQKRGEDKPLKQNDHCLDALRYGVKTWSVNKSSFASNV